MATAAGQILTPNGTVLARFNLKSRAIHPPADACSILLEASRTHTLLV